MQRDALVIESPCSHTPERPVRPRNRVRAAPVSPSTGRRAGSFDGYDIVPWHGQSRLGRRLAPVSRGPSLCGARALTKTGWIATGDRRRQIAGSRIRHDGSNTSVALLRRAEGLHQELTQWARLTLKRSLLGQRTDCLNDNRVALSKGRVDGSCRGVRTSILLNAWVLGKTVERVSLVYRNDDGVNAVTLLLVFVEGQ